MVEQKVSKYVYYQIKPFKDNDLWVGHWEKVIKNLISLKSKKISFIMYGNNTNIKLFVKLPRDFQAYFQNTFYTTFTTSDLSEVERPELSKEKVYLWLTKETFFWWKETTWVIKTKDEFMKDGSYLDPMTDIFAVFQNVDKNSTLRIQFDYTFKLEEDDLTKFLWKVKKWVNYLWGAKKEEKADAKEEKKEPEKNLFMSIR